jgi:hypothetical protein
MIKTDAIKRRVYLKFIEDQYVLDIVQNINGRLEYRHSTGKISIVRLEIPGMGTRKVRITNLPLETPERTLRNALVPYGDIISIQDERWSNTYRYTVANGVKVATIKLSKHIPSHMVIAGHRTLVSYDRQPSTCYRCGETGHVHQHCPNRRRKIKPAEKKPENSWAQILVNGPHTKHDVTQVEHTRYSDHEKAEGYGREHQNPDTPPFNEPIEKDRENACILQGRETNTQQRYTETAEQSDTDTPMEGTDSGGTELLTDDIPTKPIQNTKTTQEGRSKDNTKMAIDDHTLEGEAQGAPTAR